MKISNLDKELVSFDGDQFKDQSGKVITLRLVIFAVLDQDKDIKPEEKLDRWELQMRIRAGGDIEKNEMKLIKSLLLKSTWTPWIIGTCTNLLNDAGEKSDIVGNDASQKKAENVTESVKAS